MILGWCWMIWGLISSKICAVYWDLHANMENICGKYVGNVETDLQSHHGLQKSESLDFWLGLPLQPTPFFDLFRSKLIELVSPKRYWMKRHTWRSSWLRYNDKGADKCILVGAGIQNQQQAGVLLGTNVGPVFKPTLWRAWQSRHVYLFPRAPHAPSTTPSDAIWSWWVFVNTTWL